MESVRSMSVQLLSDGEAVERRRCSLGCDVVIQLPCMYLGKAV